MTLWWARRTLGRNRSLSREEVEKAGAGTSRRPFRAARSSLTPGLTRPRFLCSRISFEAARNGAIVVNYARAERTAAGRGNRAADSLGAASFEVRAKKWSTLPVGVAEPGEICASCGLPHRLVSAAESQRHAIAYFEAVPDGLVRHSLGRAV